MGILDTVCTVFISVLKILWSMIRDWFRDLLNLKKADIDNVFFTIQRKLSDGSYRVIRGLFNQRTDATMRVDGLKSSQIDQETLARHKNNPVQIYN